MNRKHIGKNYSDWIGQEIVVNRDSHFHPGKVGKILSFATSEEVNVLDPRAVIFKIELAENNEIAYANAGDVSLLKGSHPSHWTWEQIKEAVGNTIREDLPWTEQDKEKALSEIKEELEKINESRKKWEAG